MNRNIFYCAVCVFITLLLSLQACNQAPKHPWIGKTFEAISQEDGYRIRGGNPHTDGMDYIVFILKQDSMRLPDRAIFMTKEHLILGVTEVGFTDEVFYMVENVTDKANNAKVQYLVKKRYFPETDTADPLELWGYNKKNKRVERVPITESMTFGD